MISKKAICEVFCDSVSVRTLSSGLAVSTSIASINGDPIGFYVIGPLEDGRYRLEDAGALLPYLDGIGADLESPTRREVFETLLEEFSASYDRETMEIVSAPVLETDVPSAALKFINLLVRTSDLAFMSQDRVASTFKEDAAQLIEDKVGGNASIRYHEAISVDLVDIQPDLIIEADRRDPVALFLVQTDARILEAMMLQSETTNRKIDCSVVALMEKESAITRRYRIMASNRLEATLIYESDEKAAIERVATEALGRRFNTLH